MIPLISIYIGGTLTLLIAILHTRYYKMFNWKTDFEKITIVNAKIIYTIHLALLLLFFLIGIISILYAKELSMSVGLANGLNILFSAFWIWRLIWQFAYFKKKKRQKRSPIVVFLNTVFLLLIVSYSVPVVYPFLL